MIPVTLWREKRSLLAFQWAAWPCLKKSREAASIRLVAFNVSIADHFNFIRSPFAADRFTASITFKVCKPS